MKTVMTPSKGGSARLERADLLRVFLAKGDTIWFAYCDPRERRLWLRLDNIKLAPWPKVGRPTEKVGK